jgi:hypothetical protein
MKSLATAATVSFRVETQALLVFFFEAELFVAKVLVHDLARVSQQGVTIIIFLF